MLLWTFEYLSFSMYYGEGNGTPLQYSCLENPIDGGAWWAAVHGVAKSRTRLSDFTFTFHFHALEEEMATHSSVLAWRIPGTEGPGGLLPMGSHRVGHDWSDLAAPVCTMLAFLLGLYLREELLSQVWLKCFPKSLYQFKFSPTACENSSCSPFSPTIDIVPFS